MSNLVDHSHRILDQNVRNQTTYAVNTKIMVAAVVVLLVVVLFILLLHIYARWFWRNARIGSSNWSRRLRRRRHRMRFDFVIAEPPPFAIDAHTSKGLDKEILNTLPVFIYKKIKNKSEEMKQQDEEFGQAVEFQEDDELDCAVCLSEFEENETGRRLPKCEHIFHTDCIDMWLSSHSTCPLCRVSVIDPPHLLHQSEGAHSQNPFPNNNNSNSSSSSVDSITPVAASENQNGIFGNLPMQQPQYPANILFWGNQAYITSPLQEIVITSSSSSSSSSNNSSSSRSKPKQNLMIDVPPRRSTANLSSASSSPTTMMERSPLGNHLRNIRRLLSNSNSSTPK